ncbi:MAG: hypothetical protein AABW99_00030 [archaeon]
MKQFVVDSSTLITISGNCMIRLFKHLAEMEGIAFIIPESVYRESVATPVKIKKFELNAIRIRDAVEEGYLKVVKTTPLVKKKMNELQAISAKICGTKECHNIRLIDEGESETLALIKQMNCDALVIDERTTRMLIEEPEQLRSYLERRHQKRVELDRNSLAEFRQSFGDIPVFRSIELIALAYENGSFAKEMHKSKQSLEAALYAAKFAGASVSFDEINDYLKMVRN